MARAVLALLAALAGVAGAAKAPADALFFEDFSSGGLGQFVLSSAEKYASQPVAVEALTAFGGAGGAHALVLKAPAVNYAVAAPLRTPITPEGGLVVQYQVQLEEAIGCGGSYIKLANVSSPAFKASNIGKETEYAIMFGPDKCGTTDKVHLIIRYKNPVDGSIEEKHLAEAPRPLGDKTAHLYTLIIRTDDTFTIKIDNEVVKTGELTGTVVGPGNKAAFAPPILPPAQIDDPSDVKPATWVDEEKIPDPAASKPADWDEAAPALISDASATKPSGWLDNEPDHVADPNAAKPEHWDDEEDGVWEAPLVPNPKCSEGPGCGTWVRPNIKNPAYKGRWSAPLIDNPAYVGKWAPRQIANPLFFTDAHPHLLGGGISIGAVAIEVWTMHGGIAFTNFLLTRSEADAAAFGDATWRPTHDAQIEYTAAIERAEQKAKRAKLLESGSAVDAATAYAGEAWELVLDNPLAAVATLVALLATCIFSCNALCGGGHNHSHAHRHSHSHGEEDEGEGEGPEDEGEQHGHSHAPGSGNEHHVHGGRAAASSSSRGAGIDDEFASRVNEAVGAAPAKATQAPAPAPAAAAATTAEAPAPAAAAAPQAVKQAPAKAKKEAAEPAKQAPAPVAEAAAAPAPAVAEAVAAAAPPPAVVAAEPAASSGTPAAAAVEDDAAAPAPEPIVEAQVEAQEAASPTSASRRKSKKKVDG